MNLRGAVLWIEQLDDQLIHASLQGHDDPAYLRGSPILEVRIAINWALARVEDGADADALAVLKQSIVDADSLGERSIRVASRVALARAVNDADAADAEARLREAAGLMHDQPGPELGEIYAELSEVLSRRGMADEALHYSRRAFEVSKR